MKLYYGPGACSIGIHVLLEEIGAPYERQAVSLAQGEQHAAEYARLNPKGKVPLLVRDDGTTLTEFQAIAVWLARTHPALALLPADPDGEARALEAMDYIVATVHMQGFTRMLRPGNFAPSEADHDQVRARGREIYERGLALLDAALEGRDWLAGRFSVADCALFYIAFLGAERGQVTLPARVGAHYRRMRARPAVQRVLAVEGYAS